MENLEKMMNTLITLFFIGFFIILFLLAVYDYLLKVGFEKINKRLDEYGFPKEEYEREKTPSESQETLDQEEEDEKKTARKGR